MGIYPALQSSHADLVDGLKEGGRGTSGSMRQQRFRKILVGAQVALSVTLFAGAALLITSFIRLSQQNLGFQTAKSMDWRRSRCRQRNIQMRRRASVLPSKCSTALRNSSRHSRTRLSVAIFRSLAGNRTLYARADGDVPPVEQAGHRAKSTTLRRVISRPGESRFSPDVISMSTTLADSQNVLSDQPDRGEESFPNENPIGKTLAGHERRHAVRNRRHRRRCALATNR